MPGPRFCPLRYLRMRTFRLLTVSCFSQRRLLTCSMTMTVSSTSMVTSICMLLMQTRRVRSLSRQFVAGSKIRFAEVLDSEDVLSLDNFLHISKKTKRMPHNVDGEQYEYGDVDMRAFSVLTNSLPGPRFCPPRYSTVRTCPPLTIPC